MAQHIPSIATRSDVDAFLDARIGQGVRPGLERIAGLLEFMGDPQSTYPSIHVAGTNGKTTVSRMVQQILGTHGFAVGGFTSPHLESLEERFSLHGRPVTPEELTQAVADNAWFVVGYEQEADTTVTYFEVTAALAFAIFAEAAVDAAVIEVGLGGRLDATNVVDGAVSVITGIGMDHTEFLGDTIAEITGEKAAILKRGGTLVSGLLDDEALRVVEARVEETASTWMHAGRDYSVVEAITGVGGWQCSIAGIYGEYDDLFLPIHGRHQVDNLATAIATAEMFTGRELDPDALAVAVASTSSPGRLEVVGRRPLVLADGAHNPQGFAGLARTLADEFPSLPWHLVLGVRGDRSIADLVAPLKGLVGHVHGTRADDPASIDPETVAVEAGSILDVPFSVHPRSLEALAAAKVGAGTDGGVVVAGSLYVVGEVRAASDVLADTSSEAHLRYEAPRIGNDEDDRDEDDAYGSEGPEDPSFA